MIDKKVRAELGIRTWGQLSKYYSDADILLGNGFSILVSSAFAYDTLFSRFLCDCTQADRKRFKSFGTGNFEAILRDLGTAYRINERFGLPRKRLNEASDKVRKALISSIQAVHPSRAEFRPGVFDSLSTALSRFGRVFTLNYDLCLYHVIMSAHDQYHDGKRKFLYNDHFYKPEAPGYLRFQKRQDLSCYREVYYLHGALFIFPGAVISCPDAVKLARTDSEDLLDVITRTIAKGYRPLFVSEGTSIEKLQTIMESDYLQFAMSKLQDASNPLVIFGASLSEHDHHILETLAKTPRRIAVSIRTEGKSKAQLKQYKHSIESALKEHEVKFFVAETLFKA